jgi:hypothetical protein
MKSAAVIGSCRELCEASSPRVQSLYEENLRRLLLLKAPDHENSGNSTGAAFFSAVWRGGGTTSSFRRMCTGMADAIRCAMPKNKVELCPVVRRVPVTAGTKVEDFVVELLMHYFCVIGGELKEASDHLSRLPVLPQGEDAFEAWCKRDRMDVLDSDGADEEDAWSWSV